MKYKISVETISRTDKCRRDMKCLIEGGCPECEVERLIGTSGIFVRTTGADFCPYKMHFGQSHVCSCLVRCELYRRYRV